MPVPVTHSSLVLGLIIACLPAVFTVKLAVLSEANSVIRTAQSAILDARTTFFGLVTYPALIFLVGHNERLTLRIELLPLILRPSADKIKPRARRSRASALSNAR